jgi:hypothetical protein
VRVLGIWVLVVCEVKEVPCLYYGFGKNDLWIYANNQVSKKGGKSINEEKNG